MSEVISALKETLALKAKEALRETKVLRVYKALPVHKACKAKLDQLVHKANKGLPALPDRKVTQGPLVLRALLAAQQEIRVLPEHKGRKVYEVTSVRPDRKVI